ncbi:uncharacterized protein DSM5745_06882 [Aspergillus mulundensis]|uniref:Uncharacterized protein n=1 Tax=Aspergillus mulundensis TaxID=1810919 RepID=A0A3D8RSF7_9EURO|nr:hypothetical protein DSM5745_06882 [Aspergillus mulundensis]RDW76890.1 hypothetical protein DSM5745_06882 [Aspergillus mulundensis]
MPGSHASRRSSTSRRSSHYDDDDDASTIYPESSISNRSSNVGSSVSGHGGGSHSGSRTGSRSGSSHSRPQSYHPAPSSHYSSSGSHVSSSSRASSRSHASYASDMSGSTIRPSDPRHGERHTTRHEGQTRTAVVIEPKWVREKRAQREGPEPIYEDREMEYTRSSYRDEYSDYGGDSRSRVSSSTSSSSRRPRSEYMSDSAHSRVSGWTSRVSPSDRASEVGSSHSRSSRSSSSGGRRMSVRGPAQEPDSSDDELDSRFSRMSMRERDRYSRY